VLAANHVEMEGKVEGEHVLFLENAKGKVSKRLNARIKTNMKNALAGKVTVQEENGKTGCRRIVLEHAAVEAVQPHGHPGGGGVLVGAHVEMERKLELERVQLLENVQETDNKQTNVIFLDVIHALSLTFIMLDLDSISLAVITTMELLVLQKGVRLFVKKPMDALGLTG